MKAPPVFKPAQPAGIPPAVQRRQPAPLAGSGLRKAIQPKFGFELEVPVTLLKENRKNVDGKLTYLNGPYFKVVGDGSAIAGKMKGQIEGREVTYSPTILEIVSHPIDEHADDAEAKVGKTLDAIELFRFRLLLATSGFKNEIKLGSLEDENLKLADAQYRDYLVNAPTDTPRQSSPESAYIHLTVGVSLGALKRAGDWTMKRGVEGYPGMQTHEDAKSLLLDADLFGLMITKADLHHFDEIEEFLYLAYSQVRAIDRHDSGDTRVPGGGTKKNYTPFLLRTPFHQVFKALHAESKKFLIDHKVQLVQILAKHLHTGDQKVEKAQQYLNNIFNQTITPQNTYFGGMVERPIERTGAVGSGLSGPPIEIRPLGTDLTEKGVREVVASTFVASRNQFREIPDNSPFPGLGKETKTGQLTPLPIMTELALL